MSVAALLPRVAAFSKRHGLLLAVVAAGLSLRLLLALRLGDSLVYYDERDYHRIALNLISGRGFAGEHGATGFRPPLQPLFLAAIYSVFGPSPLAARVVQAVLATLLVPLSMGLARLVSRRTRVSNLAGMLAALHPGLAYASATLYPVTLTALAVGFGIWAAARAVEQGGRARAALAGLGLGLGALATPYFGPLGVVAALFTASRRRFVEAAVLGALTLAPLFAWSWRNSVALGTFSLGTHAGYNLALGANDRATPRSGNHIEPDLSRDEVPDGEAARDAAYRASARSWIAEHPGRYLALAAGRSVAVFDSVGRPATDGAPTSLTAQAVGWALLPLVILGVVGVGLSRRRPAAVLTAAALGLVVASAAVSIVKPRFRFPVDPALMAFAAVAVGRTESLAKRRVGLLARSVL